MLCRKNALSFSRLSIISRIRVRIVLQSSVGLFLPLSFRLVSFLPILAKILLAVRGWWDYFTSIGLSAIFFFGIGVNANLGTLPMMNLAMRLFLSV